MRRAVIAEKKMISVFELNSNNHVVMHGYFIFNRLLKLSVIKLREKWISWSYRLLECYMGT